MKPKSILFIAILSGLISTILFYLMMNAEAAEVEQEEEKVRVAVAAEDIEKDQQITEEQVTVKEIPADQLHEGMVEDAAQPVQQYALVEIKQGEVLMQHRMQHKEEETDVVSRKINDGQRGTSIEVTYVTGISNLIQPEDYVDVFLITGDDEHTETELILEKIRVLAIGEQMTEEKTDGSEEYYQAVTLEITPEEALEVIHANARGDLHLALYSKSDISDENPEANNNEEDDHLPANDIVTVPARSIIRNGPSLEAAPLEIVDKETTLKLLNEQKTDEDGRIWLEIETNDNKTGWISSRILKNSTE
jgi:pilus assembly protein CpaB